ncbi:MAG TPA: hypothetical protein VFF69_05560 [Phycisphaerales bacterium]|nr:hypothetical protein [Phycisphaerales bacterium]
MRLVTLAILIAAGPVSAQGIATYFWDVNGTGSNAASIGPGEIVELTLYADWAPHEGIVGIAGTIYDIVGVENWTTGTLTNWSRNLYPFLDEWLPDENNEFHWLEAFQLPPAFNPDFDASRPIWLYRMTWVPDDYTPRTVSVTDANHLNNDFYTDEFRTSVGYDQAPSLGATIHIVPAPWTTPLVALCVAARRRRA